MEPISKEDTDRIYMELAFREMKSSSCKKRKVGCIIQLHDANLSGGYNGTILPSQECCYRKDCGEGERLDLCPAIHAEIAAIIDAASYYDSTQGATMYTTSCVPCKMCMQAIVLAGIKRIVVAEDKDYAGDPTARRLAGIYDITIDHLPMRG